MNANGKDTTMNDTLEQVNSEESSWTITSPKCTARHRWADDSRYDVASRNGGVIAIQVCRHCQSQRRTWLAGDAREILGYRH